MARVLVVDDDPAIRQMLLLALELEGHEGQALSDGAGVAPLLERAEGRVIVLMDLMMPRMNGWEVCAQLAESPMLALRHAVVVMSASIAPGDRFPDVVRAALLKPFNLDTALRLIEALAAEPPLDAALTPPAVAQV